MDKQAKNPATEKVTITTENKTSLEKRKNSKSLEANPDCSDDLDSIVMSEPRKKIQKVTHSNMIERESVEEMKSELMRESSFVQTKIACAIGSYHTITLSDDGTAHSFGRNCEGQLGLGPKRDALLPTPIPNLPQINMISCGGFFTVCVDYEGFIWSFGENKKGQLGIGNTKNFNVLKNF